MYGVFLGVYRLDGRQQLGIGLELLQGSADHRPTKVDDYHSATSIDPCCAKSKLKRNCLVYSGEG